MLPHEAIQHDTGHVCECTTPWTACSGHHCQPGASPRAQGCHVVHNSCCARGLYLVSAVLRVCIMAGSHAQILERPEDRHFYFNSCRIPWRLAVYYS